MILVFEEKKHVNMLRYHRQQLPCDTQHLSKYITWVYGIRLLDVADFPLECVLFLNWCHQQSLLTTKRNIKGVT